MVRAKGAHRGTPTSALCALASLSAALFPLTSAILPNMAAGSQFACLGPQLGLEFLLILGC